MGVYSTLPPMGHRSRKIPELCEFEGICSEFCWIYRKFYIDLRTNEACRLLEHPPGCRCLFQTIVGRKTNDVRSVCGRLGVVSSCYRVAGKRGILSQCQIEIARSSTLKLDGKRWARTYYYIFLGVCQSRSRPGVCVVPPALLLSGARLLAPLC